MYWLFLVLTATTSFQEFPQLRDQEAWEEIVVSGEKALESASKEEAVQIHGHLASSYFYQGNFAEAALHAALCYEIACELEDLDQEVHGLYLLSAVARAEGEFIEAKTIALEALPLSRGEWKAKVLFNLGAAEMDDPQGNLSAAQIYLDEAMTLFECSDDRQRTAIRLAKIYLMLGKAEKGREILDEIIPEIQSKRILMHAEYLAAQIERAQGNKEEARTLAQKALIKAKDLQAKKDEMRIEEFCESL